MGRRHPTGLATADGGKGVPRPVQHELEDRLPDGLAVCQQKAGRLGPGHGTVDGGQAEIERVGQLLKCEPGMQGELQNNDEFKETILVYLKLGGISLARHYAETTVKFLNVDVLEIGTGLRFPKVVDAKQDDENDDDDEDEDEDEDDSDDDDLDDDGSDDDDGNGAAKTDRP